MVNTLNGTKRQNFIDIRHAYIRETLERQAIHLAHVPLEEEKADCLTKPLGRVKFEEQCRMLSLFDE